MSERKVMQDIETAKELATFFNERGIDPAESLMVVAALHSLFIIQARDEGKEASPETYSEIYKGGLEIYLPIVEILAHEKKRKQGYYA